MREITFAEAIREGVRGEMLRDERVFLLGEDIGRLGNTFKVLDGLWREFGPQRVIESPISEASIGGAAYGAALAGMRPVFEIMYIDFALLALEQLLNHAAKMRYISNGQYPVPLVIRTQEGGRSSQGPQHSQCLEAIFAHSPGLKVVMPAFPADAKGLLTTAIRDEDPVIFIEHKFLYFKKGPVPEGEHLIPFGKARIVREGKDVTIVGISHMVHYALEAAEKLAEEGIEAEVIDPRTLVPFDEETVFASLAKTGRLLIAHEAVRRCGFGAEIASLAVEKAFRSLKAPVRIVAAKNTPLPFSPSVTTALGYGAMPDLAAVLSRCKEPLEEAVLPQVRQVVSAAKELVSWRT